MALVSSVDLKKADGSPLKVNFQFENGLPVMPIIANNYKFGFKSNDNLPIFVMILKNDDTIYKKEKIKKFLYERKKSKFTLWVVFESFYICFHDISTLYKNFHFGVINENNEFLEKCLVNAN